MDYINMANLPVALPFPLEYNSHPLYNAELFPNNMNFMNSYLHPRHRRTPPIDMHTLGMISQLAPKIRQLNVQGKIGDELAHTASKVATKHRDHNFHVNLDVELYAPEELTVKVVNDHLLIEGKHEERQADDIGYVSRHFMRRYELPKDCNPNTIVSKLSPDGVLTVLIPKPTEKPKERIVNIQLTGRSEKQNNESIKIDKDTTERGKEVVKENK